MHMHLSFSKSIKIAQSPKDECHLRSLKNSRLLVLSIQISRETILLRINNIHKNVRDNRSFGLRL